MIVSEVEVSLLAVYHLGFYELDQPIEVGGRGTFHFFLDPYFSEVESLEIIPEGMLLVFYNCLGDCGRVLTLDCTIKKIHHIEFGNVRKIDTNGFTYTLTTDSGDIQVDAEEQAGEVQAGWKQPEGWIFTVGIELHSIVKLDPKARE